MAPRGLTRLVLVLSAAVAAPPGAVDGTQPDHILDDHFEERPELLPVDDDEGPFRIVTGNPTYRPTYRPTAFIIHVPVPGFPREEEGEDHYQPTYRPTSRARIDPCARIACHVEIPKQCRSEDGESCSCVPADEPCPGEEIRVHPCPGIECPSSSEKRCLSEDGESCPCQPADEPCPGEEHRGRKLLRGGAP